MVTPRQVRRDLSSAFVRRLKEAAWVPDADGTLNPPRLVTFDSLGWKPNPFLLTKIQFKPPIIDQLAKEAGIDPAALDLLRRYGITSVAELASRLGITEAPPEPEPEPATEDESHEPPSESDVYGEAKDLYGDDMPDIPPGSHDPEGDDGEGGGGAGGGTGGGKTGTGTGGSPKDGGTGGAADGKGRTGDGRGKGGTGPGKGTPGAGGGRPFISYVGTHPDERNPTRTALTRRREWPSKAGQSTRSLRWSPHYSAPPTAIQGLTSTRPMPLASRSAGLK